MVGEWAALTCHSFSALFPHPPFAPGMLMLRPAVLHTDVKTEKLMGCLTTAGPYPCLCGGMTAACKNSSFLYRAEAIIFT